MSSSLKRNSNCETPAAKRAKSSKLHPTYNPTQRSVSVVTIRRTGDGRVRKKKTHHVVEVKPDSSNPPETSSSTDGRVEIGRNKVLTHDEPHQDDVAAPEVSAGAKPKRKKRVNTTSVSLSV